MLLTEQHASAWHNGKIYTWSEGKVNGDMQKGVSSFDPKLKVVDRVIEDIEVFR
jgi:hypothetical protein